MPVLVLTGEKASGPFLIDQPRLVASNVKGVIVEGSGHWLIDEAPGKVTPALSFLADMVDPFNQAKHPHWIVKGPSTLAEYDLEASGG